MTEEGCSVGNSDLGWPCEAYGEEGLSFGALCFISADRGKRVCSDPADCAAVMAPERTRVHGAIRKRAAEGDEVCRYLADLFDVPERLLGGGEPPGRRHDPEQEERENQ